MESDDRRRALAHLYASGAPLGGVYRAPLRPGRDQPPRNGGACGHDMVGERLVLPLQLEHVARHAQPAREPCGGRRDVLFPGTDIPSARAFRIDHIANVCVLSHREGHLPVRRGRSRHREGELQRLELPGRMLRGATSPEVRNGIALDSTYDVVGLIVIHARLLIGPDGGIELRVKIRVLLPQLFR